MWKEMLSIAARRKEVQQLRTAKSAGAGAQQRPRAEDEAAAQLRKQRGQSVDNERVGVGGRFRNAETGRSQGRDGQSATGMAKLGEGAKVIGSWPPGLELSDQVAS